MSLSYCITLLLVCIIKYNATVVVSVCSRKTQSSVVLVSHQVRQGHHEPICVCTCVCVCVCVCACDSSLLPFPSLPVSLSSPPSLMVHWHCTSVRSLCCGAQKSIGHYAVQWVAHSKLEQSWLPPSSQLIRRGETPIFTSQ